MDSEKVSKKEEALPVKAVAEVSEDRRPKTMDTSISPYAQDVIRQLEEALKSGDGDELSNIVFDAECENLGNQIDLNFYE